MIAEGLRLLTLVHGHLAALATALLFHPALLLWRGQPLSRGTRWAVALAAALTAWTFAMGFSLYDDYRALVRRDLFLRSPRAGLLFETKEHLGFMVLALALGAAAAAWFAPREDAHLRRYAARVFALAGVLAILTGGIGTYVTSLRSF